MTPATPIGFTAPSGTMASVPKEEASHRVLAGVEHDHSQPGRALRQRRGLGDVVASGAAQRRGQHVLPPEREHVAPYRDHIAAAHPPEPADLEQAAGHYARLAAVTGSRVGRSDGSQAVARLQAETGNITAMLEYAVAHDRATELADAIGGPAQYWRFTGYTDPALARNIEDTISAHGTLSQQAAILFAFGNFGLARSDR